LAPTAMRALLVLLVLAPLCAARPRKGKDYYAILGVPDHTSDKVVLKKAYREKSLEFHPDKCVSTGSSTEECQAKFIEVSTAHEVLSDPEKKQIYDRDGEEGLKEGGNGGGKTGEEAKQMFRQFFGREPDGNVRIVNRGGQMMFMEEGEPGSQENIYDDSNATELTSDIYKAYVNERIEPWVIQFYKPNNDESVEIHDEYVKFADTFKAFLNVAVVNCRKQRDICSGASINDFPAFRWFPAEKDSPPEVFDEGTPSAKTLGKWANKLMPDHTTILEDKRQLRQWLDNQKLPTAVLFTDKSSAPPMWKALSREFNGRAALAVVLRCDKVGVFKTPLQREYDVKIPQIVKLDPVDEIGKVAEKFESAMRKDILNLWLIKIIAVGRKAGPAASFREWTKERLEAGDCGSGDSQFCFLWLKAGADPAVEDATRQLAQKYRTDPIKLMWVNIDVSFGLLEAFGIPEAEASDFFVAFRPKRSRFKVHTGPLRFAELDAFVDGVINGGPLEAKLKVPKIEL